MVERCWFAVGEAAVELLGGGDGAPGLPAENAAVVVSSVGHQDVKCQISPLS